MITDTLTNKVFDFDFQLVILKKHYKEWKKPNAYKEWEELYNDPANFCYSVKKVDCVQQVKHSFLSPLLKGGETYFLRPKMNRGVFKFLKTRGGGIRQRGDLKY